MIDKETARVIALTEIDTAAAQRGKGIECVLLDEYTLEKEYGWVFFYQSREFVETGDPSAEVGGNGPILVQKADGQVVRFGTACSVEKSLAGYEAGYHLDVGTLTILRVFDRDRTLSCLHRLRLCVVVPEFAYGVTWRIPKALSWKQLEMALENLPTVFEEVGIAMHYETFLEVEASACCDFSIEPLPKEQHPNTSGQWQGRI